MSKRETHGSLQRFRCGLFALNAILATLSYKIGGSLNPDPTKRSLLGVLYAEPEPNLGKRNLFSLTMKFQIDESRLRDSHRKPLRQRFA